MHFPAGAVKKDGPSAGIAIAAALISIALQKPIKSKTAMTGEISLTGNYHLNFQARFYALGD